MLPPLDRRDLAHVLAHTQAVWEQLRGARIFITGGTGFIGCWLLESFAYANKQLALKASIVVLSRNPAAFLKKMPHLAADTSISLHQGDVRDFCFPSGTFSHVIHGATAASAQLNQDAPLLMLDVIIKGSQQTFDFARAAGAKKVLLLSSGAIYGQQPPELTHIDEDFTGSPLLSAANQAYGIGKRTAEHLAALYQAQHGLSISIARCFAFVGPHLPLDQHFAIGNFIGNALKGDTIAIAGDGSPHRSYQYAADLAIWLWQILCFGDANRAYNVGSDQSLSIRDLSRCVADCVDPPLAIAIAKPAGSGLPARYVPSIARAQRELQLINRIDLPTAIRRTLAWHRRFCS